MRPKRIGLTDAEIGRLNPVERALVASAVAGIIDQNLQQDYDPDMAAPSAAETDAETFKYVGVEWLELMIRHAGLAPGHAVLDIGCGGGRMAYPLTLYLNKSGSYFGFDPNDRTVAHLRARIRHPSFRVEHVDLHHRFYRPEGTIDPRTYRLPCEDGSIDVALAASILTHMELDVARHYLRETCRVLKPGGHAVISIFGLTADMGAPEGGVTALHGHGGEESPYAFRFKHLDSGFYGRCDAQGNPKGHQVAGGTVADPVAYDIDAFTGHCEQAGLAVACLLPGAWCRREYLHGYQDMFVLRKPLHPGNAVSPGADASSVNAAHAAGGAEPTGERSPLRSSGQWAERISMLQENEERKKSARESASLRRQLAAGRSGLDRVIETLVRLRRNPLTRPLAPSKLLDAVRDVRRTLAAPPAPRDPNP